MFSTINILFFQISYAWLRVNIQKCPPFSMIIEFTEFSFIRRRLVGNFSRKDWYRKIHHRINNVHTSKMLCYHIFCCWFMHVRTFAWEYLCDIWNCPISKRCSDLTRKTNITYLHTFLRQKIKFFSFHFMFNNA